MKKNDLFEVTITDLSHDGEGVGRTDAFIWFIKDTVPGDRVRASVMKMKKTYGYARLQQVLEPSPDRMEPLCPIARSCGGCTLQAMSYEAQLAYKKRKVEENLRRIGGFTPGSYEIFDTIGMESPWRYRNKAVYPIGTDRDGKVITGFYAGHSHTIIPCEDCLIGAEENEAILKVFREHYDDGMRHILIRQGQASGQTMVCAVTRRRRLRQEAEIAGALQALGVDTFVLNCNPEETNVILGREERVIYGPGYIEDSISGLSFRISARSFYQVNPVQVERLYGKAVEYAALTGKETVWDLYCGIGTISLAMARQAGTVRGVEIVEAAIQDARDNAVRNGISNAEFFVGKAEEVLPRERDAALAAGGEAAAAARPEVIVVDPPRKGCDEVCLATMLEMGPDRIVYVSCDSATLARDLKILCGGGYRLEKVQPVDMFPESVHIEVVSLLQRVSNTRERTITLDVEMEDYHRIVNGDDHNK